MPIYMLAFYLLVVESKSLTNLTYNAIYNPEVSQNNENIANAAMQVVEDVCIPGNTDRTSRQLHQVMQHINDRIGEYKDVVKFKKQIHADLQWILKEDPGSEETSTVLELIKRDISRECLTYGRDCTDLKRQGLKSGFYTVYTSAMRSFRVYCDMDTDGGGWTVFQKRLNGKVDFQRDWKSYRNGFGTDEEYWLGNEKISQFTNNGMYELRIDLESFSGQMAYAKYFLFSVGDESTKYTLTVEGYKGTAGDSLYFHNNMKFSTNDQDNDNYGSSNCATDHYNGGWWYNDCAHSALNALYGKNNKNKITWVHWSSYSKNIKSTSMMFRKIN